MEKNKILINVILILGMLIVIVFIAFEKYKENSINDYNYETQKLNTQSDDNLNIKNENIVTKITENETDLEQEKTYPKEDIIETYKGYDVCAKLEIPTISLETNILSNYSTKALNVSVTKFCGVEPNCIGNFCVAGHNFKNKNMFSNLKELNLGDKLFVTDRDVGKVEYEIFDIYKVVPEDTSCLKPVTDNEREITLITCTSDSKKRIIIKAKEI